MDKKDVLKKNSIAVITVCRNEDKYIEPFIKSVLASTVPVDLILVDNNSDVASKLMLEAFSRDAIILWQEKNLGFGIANNVGIKYAIDHGAEYLFLLNMDMLIEPDTIETLLKISQRNPDFSLISPMCFNFEKNALEQMFFESLTNKNLQYDFDARLFFSEAYFQKRFSKELYESTYINAAHWFMPIETIKQVGGFNPVFYPIYAEDAEFLNRLGKRNFKVGFTPSARVFHDTEKRAKASVLDDSHSICICSYLEILKSKYWQTYYFFLILFLLRILKYLFLFQREGIKSRFLGMKAFLRWRKILRQTWLVNHKKESIGLFCDIPQKYIPPYIKH